MKPTVLLINFKDKEKMEIIKGIILRENAVPREVEKKEYGQTIGALAGIPELYDKSIVYRGEEIGQEMMIFAGLNDTVLDNILAGMRERGTKVNYKAVMTPYNIAWKIPALYLELAKEHEEMTKQFGSSK